MTNQIPVTIVTGFLGAGKTTLLSNLLPNLSCHSPDRQIAVLVNEFGEVSIDSAILRKGTAINQQSVTIHESTSGLIAYSDDRQFLPTMLAIQNRQTPVDNVLIETSGLALPTAIMVALSASELKESFKLDAVLAVVDTELLLSGHFDRQDEAPPTNILFESRRSVASLFKQQLENSDVVVLNKIDKLSDDQLMLSEMKIRQLAPKVRFVELARQAQLDQRIVLGLRLHEATNISAKHNTRTLASISAGPSSLNGHAHSGLASHDHGLHTHQHFHEQDPGWLSFVLTCHGQLQQENLATAISQITRDFPILRLKGFVRFAHSANLFLLQGVREKISYWPERNGDRHGHDQIKAANFLNTENSANTNRHKETAEIVFIGYHLDREALAKALSTATSAHWH